MKNLYILFSTVLVSLLIIPSHKADAQIWKKIKKKTQDKVENVIVDKTSDKAAELAAKNMDKALNADINPFGKGVKKADPKDLPDSYTFTWKYELRMKSNANKKQGDLMFDYYLSPDAPYFGFTMPQMASMFSVIDNDKNVMISYMEQDGQSIAVSYKMPETENNDEASEDFTVTELPDKEFLGYNSKGLQLENSEYRMIMYWAPDAEVSFNDALSSKKSKVPENLKSYIKDNGKGLMMYMKYIGKTDKKMNLEMECLSLEETILVKNNSQYSFQ